MNLRIILMPECNISVIRREASFVIESSQAQVRIRSGAVLRGSTIGRNFKRTDREIIPGHLFNRDLSIF